MVNLLKKSFVSCTRNKMKTTNKGNLIYGRADLSDTSISLAKDALIIIQIQKRKNNLKKKIIKINIIIIFN